MRFPFHASGGLVLVNALVKGPERSDFARMALDTGATKTTLSPTLLSHLGYDISELSSTASVATGSAIEMVPVVSLSNIFCLGHVKDNLSIMAIQLPVAVQLDGVIGLDFLRDHILTLDFVSGEVELR